MPTNARIIQTATELARRNWTAYTQTQLKTLVGIFSTANLQVVQRLARLSKNDTFKYAQFSTLQRTIAHELKVARDQLDLLTTKGMEYSIDQALKDSIEILNKVDLKKGVDIQIGTSYFNRAGELVLFDASRQAWAQSMWGKLHKDALDHLLRYRPWGFALSKDIWNVTWQAQRQLLQRIGSAIVTGEKISTLIPDINSILGVSETSVSLTTGRGIYKSATKNASRLLRTELNRAYVEGQVRYMHLKEFIAGGIHRTGSGNPCEECEDLAGTFYPKGEGNEIPVHPHCMCWLEYVLEREAESA